jgi:hypothetical protein
VSRLLLSPLMTNQLSTSLSYSKRRQTSRNKTISSSSSKTTTTTTTTRTIKTMMASYLFLSSSSSSSLAGGRGGVAAFVIRNAAFHSGKGRSGSSSSSTARYHQRSNVLLSVAPTVTSRFPSKTRLYATTTDVTDASSSSISSSSSSSSSSTTNFIHPYDVHNKEAGLGTYTPAEFERDIYSWWEQSGCFQPDSKQSSITAKNNNRTPYVLPMPPPNVTGKLHMGHAIFVALQDILARFHRMRGRPVLWLPGR